MKNFISFVLILFGIVLLCCDADNMTHFYLSKLIGIIIVFAGAFLLPKSAWK